MPPEEAQPQNLWIAFALMTVASWGLYGVLLHTGQLNMGDPTNGRYKAFFWVGVAYFLAAVLAPAGMLIAQGASWAMPAKGIAWSMLAGISGSIGAFCVLLAFGAKGHPAAVMSIVFAGAPIVNAIVALSIHPPQGGFGAIRPAFIAGIVLAALGGTLVTMYKPASPPPKAQAAAEPAPDGER